MKIQIKSYKGQIIKECFFNFDDLMHKAQGATNTNPVNAATSMLSERLKSEGIVLDRDALTDLEKKLGDFAVVGDDSKTLTLRTDRIASKNSLSEGGGDMYQSELFEKVILYPDPLYKKICDSLIGLDKIKDRLIKETIFMTSPDSIRDWSKNKHDGREIAALKTLEQRSPFLIFGGDVGTGKTALAESFGNAIAESIKKPVKLFKFSILTRGSGIVGDMTRLITAAFKTVEVEVSSFDGPLVLLLDEADTLAQSREAIQMHHEDKAGVNALIQGIDRMRFQKKPVLVIFCTNRLSAIDPAIRRRAVDIFEFERPDEKQRKHIFEIYTKDIKLNSGDIQELVDLTGPSKKCSYGFSYSDLINKVIPIAIFGCYPDKPFSFNALKEAILNTKATKPFDERYGSKK